MNEPRTDSNPFVTNFTRFEREQGRNGAPWLSRLRSRALARFAELGFPTPALEEWKYTDVSPIARQGFRTAPPSNGRALDPTLLEPLTFKGLKCAQLVFLNGRHVPELSTHGPLPRGVRVTNLASALKSDPDLLESHLARHADFDRTAFTALNTAYFEDGAFVAIPAGVALDQPVHLMFLSSPTTEPIASHPRNLVLVGEGSQATVIETYASSGPGVYLTNAVTELVAGPASVVDHYKLQREDEQAFHVSTLQVEQARDSHFASHSASFGGALVRNDINTTFTAEGGECALNGLYAVGGRQHVDNHTKIDHVSPRCSSRELYKGILDGESSGVFYGMIFVRKDAQKTDANQTNKNLVLSDKALVNSTPALDINADDVKCTHASATGQLDKNAIFYLRSRGIDEAAARSLLIYAFARDVLSRVKLEPVQAKLDELLVSRLPSGLVAPEVL